MPRGLRSVAGSRGRRVGSRAGPPNAVRGERPRCRVRVRARAPRRHGRDERRLPDLLPSPLHPAWLPGALVGFALHVGLGVHRPGAGGSGPRSRCGHPEHLRHSSGRPACRVRSPRQPGARAVLSVPGTVEPHAGYCAASALLPAPAAVPPLPSGPAGQFDHALAALEPAQNVGLFLQLGRLGRLSAAGGGPRARAGGPRDAGYHLCARHPDSTHAVPDGLAARAWGRHRRVPA